MWLRRAVLQIPPRSSVPRCLPFYKILPLLTHLESTLPQVLISPHFKSRISNTYKKPGGGCPSLGPNVLQLVTPSALVIPRVPRNLLCPLSCVSASLHPYPVASPSHGSRSRRLSSLQNCASISFHATYGSFVFILLRTLLYRAKCYPQRFLHLTHSLRKTPGAGVPRPAVPSFSTALPFRYNLLLVSIEENA
jgi:hypothetical protein